jgi:hypothetical protein
MQQYNAKISKKICFWLLLLYIKCLKIVVSLTIVYETTCETNVNKFEQNVLTNISKEEDWYAE